MHASSNMHAHADGGGERTAAYRPDIDGLRAVAVLAVIAFHINRNWLPGGFYGVDVFFVISGFLITANILRAQAPGADGQPSFTYLGFLAGRIKRLAPAMLFVVAATVIAAQLLLRPEDAVGVAHSALWAVFSASNCYFWLFSDNSYFAASSAELPLLHLWSLGIEEQFYLLWPPLLLLMHRVLRPVVLLFVVLAAAVASICVPAMYTGIDPMFSYYMLPTRCGALLLGCALSLLLALLPHLRLGRTAADLAGFTGAALLAAGFVLLSESYAYPGLHTFIPALGTLLLLLAGLHRGALLTLLLNNAVLVQLGRVSYSAYLWHWPLLAFYRYGHADVSLAAGCYLLAITIVLAFMSHRLLELPLRQARLSPKQVTARMLLLPGAAIVWLAVAMVEAKGLLLRNNGSEYARLMQQTRAEAKPVGNFPFVCQHAQVLAQHLHEARCVSGAATGHPPSVLVWGDSNSAHYVGMLSAFANVAGARMRNIAHTGCPPLLEAPDGMVNVKRLAECKASLPHVHRALSQYRVVVLSASWNNYVVNSKRFMPALFRTANALTRQGKQVVILGRVPTMRGLDPRCVEKALSYPGLDCHVASQPLDRLTTVVNAALKHYAEAAPNVTYYDANTHLCPAGLCGLRNAQGLRMYADANHLSMQGSLQLGRSVLQHDGLPAAFNVLRARSAFSTAPAQL